MLQQEVYIIYHLLLSNIISRCMILTIGPVNRDNQMGETPSSKKVSTPSPATTDDINKVDDNTTYAVAMSAVAMSEINN